MPRPANPAVRGALLDAGSQLLNGRGFHASGVKDITLRAGVPKGSFYTYFASKDEFGIAVVEEHWAAFEAGYGALLQDPSLPSIERVSAFFATLAQEAESRDFTLGCLLGNLSLELADEHPEMRATLAALFARWQHLLADCLAAARDDGDLSAERDPAEVAATLIEAWQGAVLRAKVERTGDALGRFRAVVLPRLLK